MAEANLAAAESAARGLGAQLGTQRWKLQNASEQVDAQVALLRSQVAALRSQEAILDKARADFNRAEALLPAHAVSRSDYDQYEQQLRVAAASLTQAQEAIAQTRVSLGLAPQPEKGKGLSDVPPDLNQTFSSVRGALADCMLTMTQLGIPLASTDLTPNKAIEEFRQLDKKGDIDQILQDLVPQGAFRAPGQAELEEARHDLELAELNLRYCDITSEIDGVVTGKNVNPGNAVQAGQALMAVRSLTGIWIDANFKETQLADLRIGQRCGARWTCTATAGVRGPDHRVHHGDRSNALPAAGAERHRQLRQDRPAPAGPGRTYRLRFRKGTPVRRTVGDALRVLQGAAHGAARGRDLAAVGGPSDRNQIAPDNDSNFVRSDIGGKP